MENRYIFPIPQDANQTNYYWFEEGFTSQELAMIEDQISRIDFVRGVTQAGDGLEETDYRRSSIKWVPFDDEFKWIYDKIGAMAYEANKEYVPF
jgi:hypothetical protein